MCVNIIIYIYIYIYICNITINKKLTYIIHYPELYISVFIFMYNV